MVEATAARLKGYNSAEIAIGQLVDLWDPPMVSSEAPSADEGFQYEKAFDATAGNEHFYQPSDESDMHQILRGSGSQGKLITGITVLATLALGALAYVYWPAAVEKTDIENAEVTSAVQSAPGSAAQSPAVAPVEAAPRRSEPTFVAPAVLAWPDLPPTGTVAAFPQIAAAAPPASAEVSQAAPALQNRDIVFVQRPGVNIRSAPSTNGTVVGSAPKGKRFKVAKRDGDWVQVMSDPVKGWIKSEFLAPTKPK